MNNRLTSRLVVHFPQEEMLLIVLAAAMRKMTVSAFIIQAARDTAKRVLCE
jgi:uncharacterized protein (DUF1778 family)